MSQDAIDEDITEFGIVMNNICKPLFISGSRRNNRHYQPWFDDDCKHEWES